MRIFFGVRHESMGELLMLGFRVSQSTVSRYMPTPGRRPTQSWRTFIRNQASAFRHREEVAEESKGDAGLRVQCYRTDLMQSAATPTLPMRVGLRRGLAWHQPAQDIRRTSLCFPQRGVMHRARRIASASGGSRRALDSRRVAALPIRSPPQRARASYGRAGFKTSRSCSVAPNFMTVRPKLG